ncbi:MAG TPA: type II CAAX endopeptidase family protein [Candidatus Saccharimonadales bacterium]|nr:type II CAAX endopeptidase family protein [Candidatus Saccharimonadales bacterium]
MENRNPNPESPNPESAASASLPWNLWQAIVFVVLAFLASSVVIAPIFVQLVAAIYGSVRHWSADQISNWVSHSLVTRALYGLVAYGCILGSVYLFLKYYERPWTTIGLKKPRWVDPAIGLTALPVYLLFYGALTVAIAHFVPSLNLNQQQQTGFSNIHGGLALSVTFISLVLLPAFVEEVIMRGFLFTSLRKSLNLWPAALITSVLFAAGHLPEGGTAGPLWIAAIDTFALSIVLCYLREKTTNLWAGITLHGLKNSIAFVALFILTVH